VGRLFFFTIQQQESAMKTKTMSLDKIIMDDEINPREIVDQEYINELAEAIENGAKIPPVAVFERNEKFYLADGFHRCEAYKKIGKDRIKVKIREGGRRKAILFACGANTKHGRRRTNEDKRYVAFKLLKDKKWNQWSDGKIAKRCLVSQAFVSKLRRELTQNGFELNDNRKGINGKTINTKNIGKTSSSDKSDDTTGDVTSVELPGDDAKGDESGMETDTNEGQKKHRGKKDRKKRVNGKKGSDFKLSKREFSDIAQQLLDLNSRLIKVKAIIEEDKTWSETRIKKLTKLKREMETAWILLTGLIENLIDNSV
jgi:hypothetical protein